MFQTSSAGSLPKPAWLSETEKLWPQWKAQGAELQQAKADATLLWIKAQEDAGVDIDAGNELVRRIQKLNPSIGGFSGLVPFGESRLIARVD